MKVEVKTYWSDLDQAKEFAEEVSKLYPNLKLYLSLVNSARKPEDKEIDEKEVPF